MDTSETPAPEIGPTTEVSQPTPEKAIAEKAAAPKSSEAAGKKASDKPAIIEFLQVGLTYPNGFQALKNINLSVAAGDFLFLVGSSGSGKSSLMKLVYRELEPTAGAVYVEGKDLADLKRSELPYLRRKVSVIFQDFRLLPNKSAYHNVAFALEVTATPPRQIPTLVTQALEMVNLSEKADRLPGQMSGGEQQRVAIARALVGKPKILVADEPTGNLDPDSSWDIMQTLSKVNATGTTLMVATHNQQIVDTMRKRVLVMHAGHLSRDERAGRYYTESQSL